MSVGPHPTAWHRFALGLAGASFSLAFLSAHDYSLRAVVRTPVVLMRLLVDHPASFWPAFGAMLVFGLALASDRRSPRSAMADRTVSVAVFVFGVSALIWFLPLGARQWGLGPDWNKDWLYYRALQEAVEQFRLPYYIRTMEQGTERLFANLEAPLGPDALLLAVLPIPALYVLRLVCCFTVGYYAAVRLRDHLQLSLAWWAAWMVLFVLNGHILSHLGAGHTPWAGYFLVPLVFLAVLTMEPPGGAGATVLLALTLGAMVVLGSFHVFVWSLIFSLAYAAFRPALIGRIGRALIIVALLTAYRMLPGVATFGGGDNTFAGSYDTAAMFLAGVTGGPMPVTQLGLHEYDLFVGWVGLAMLCVAFVPGRRGESRPLTALTIASVVMIALSMFKVYQFTLFTLPGFVSQRVAARLAVLGILGLLLVASRRLTVMIPRERMRMVPVAAATFAAAAWLAVQLAIHAEGLRPALHPSPDATDVLKSVPVETGYWWSVWIGLAVSITSLTGVLHWVGRGWYDRDRRR